jgi:hypothetical protein
VTLAINPSETQARVSGGCERGKAVMSNVHPNGSVDCLYVDTPTPAAAVILDSVGDVGSHLSARQEGTAGVNPGIAYYDASNGRLKYVRCSTGTCSAVDPPVILDDPANNVGQFPSVKFISPNLGIAYYDVTAQDLKLALCSNFDCSGTVTTRVLDAAGNVGRNAAIMSVASRFAVAYFDANNNNYKYVRCNDAACSAPVPRTLTGLGGGGLLFSTVASVRDQNLTLPEFIVLEDGSDIQLVRCTDVDCAAFTTTLVSNSTDVGPPLAMMRATISGTVHRWFSYARPTAGTLQFRVCTGEACSSVASASGGTFISNPIANGFVMTDSLAPLYMQTRSGSGDLIQTIPFAGLTAASATGNQLAGSNNATAALDTFKGAFVGPAVVFYDSVADNLVYLYCTREDCSDL